MPFTAPALVFHFVLSLLKVKMYQQNAPHKYSDRGKNVSLMLRLTKTIHGIGNIFVLGFGF